jgi:hypothetical protein
MKVWILVLFLILLLFVGYISYWLFYPRFTHISYGYEWGEDRIDGLSCTVRFEASYQEGNSDKVMIYRSPYDIWISFETAENSHIAITKVRLLSNQKIIYKSDDIVAENFEEGKWKSILYGKMIDLEYLDYTVVLEYVRTVNGKEETGNFEVLLKQKYIEKKYSMLDNIMSI